MLILDLLSILPLIAELIMKVFFVTIAFAIIYVWLSTTFKSLAKQKKFNIFFYYGATVPLIYIFYLPILKIGGVDNFNSVPVIFKAYMVAIGFASIPRFFIFYGKPDKAEDFLLVLSTAIFLALAVISTGYVAPDKYTLWSENILPNKLAYLIVWLTGISVGFINEYLVKPLLEFLIEKRKKL